MLMTNHLQIDYVTTWRRSIKRTTGAVWRQVLISLDKENTERKENVFRGLLWQKNIFSAIKKFYRKCPLHDFLSFHYLVPADEKTFRQTLPDFDFYPD